MKVSRQENFMKKSVKFSIFTPGVAEIANNVLVLEKYLPTRVIQSEYSSSLISRVAHP